MGTQLSPEKGHTPAQFLAHVYCVQTAEWMEAPLGTEVDLGPGHLVLDGVPALRERGTAALLFSAHVCCGHGRPSQLLLSSCQNSFTNRLNSKFLVKRQLDIPPYLKRVATVPYEMCVLKNRHAPQVSETNCRARLSHSKQLLNADKYLPSGVSIIWFTDEKDIYSGHTENSTEWPDCTPLATKKKDVLYKAPVHAINVQ